MIAVWPSCVKVNRWKAIHYKNRFMGSLGVASYAGFCSNSKDLRMAKVKLRTGLHDNI